jgi:tight adherence protein B
MLVLITLSAFLTVTLLAFALGRQLFGERALLRARVQAVATDNYARAGKSSRPLLRMEKYSSLPFLRNYLRRRPSSERIADELEAAGLTLKVGEYLLLRVVVGLLTATLVRWFLPPDEVGGELVSVALMALGFLVGIRIPPLVVRRLIRRRLAQVEAQLPDALDMISRSLRAGGGLLAAIDVMVEQMPGAIGAEFGRARQEIATGLSLEAAFRALDRRLPSKDLHIVVTAILIQREVGGNLAEILDNVAATIRDRLRLRGEMRALTSRQRLSAYLIAAVPPFIVVVMVTGDSGTAQSLLHTTAGWAILGFAAALELAGVLTVHHLSSSFEV